MSPERLTQRGVFVNDWRAMSVEGIGGAPRIHKGRNEHKTLRQWMQIRDQFVLGIFVNGRHHYPTMEELAHKHRLRVKTLHNKSEQSEPSWMKQRQNALAMVQSRTDTLQADRIAEARVTFDNETLLTARAALRKLMEILAAWSGIEVSIDPETGAAKQQLRRRAAADIRLFAGALVDLQRVGRLALGFATENVSFRGAIKVGLAEAMDEILERVDLEQLTKEELNQIERLAKLPELVAAREDNANGGAQPD